MLYYLYYICYIYYIHIFYKKNFHKKIILQEPQNVEKMIKKSPALNAIFENTELQSLKTLIFHRAF